MTNLASPWKRVCASAIDILIYLNLELWGILQIVNGGNLALIMDNALNLLMIIIFGGLVYGLLNSILTAKSGGSIGKLITGLQVVDPDNKKITFWNAVLRYYVGYFVSSTFLWLGHIWIFKDKEHRGWHDMIANTYVVTQSKSRVFLGIIINAALIATCGYFLTAIASQTTKHMPLYTEIFTDIKSELMPSPTPTILPTKIPFRK